jgi:hypothetical protein
MSVRRATSLVITVPALDSFNRPARKSGVVFVSGDTKISKDGAAFANTTNQPTEIGSSGRYALTLAADEMDASWVHIYISKSGIDDFDQLIGTAGDPSGQVVANGGNTSSTFETNRAEATTDFWKDALILFTTGTLAGQVKKISAYNGTTKFITTSTAFTSAPSASDRFVLVNI